MWIMMFINITCGIGLIAVASPMAQDTAFAHLDADEAARLGALLVGAMGVFNGLGRFGWASASDYLGRPGTYAAFFGIQIVAFALLAQSPPTWAFVLLVLLILTCYGGGFATLPAFLGDLFGTKRLGAIHGCTLTAWSAAGLFGPLFVTEVQERTGRYDTTLYIFAGLFAVALVMTFLMALDIRGKRAALAARSISDALETGNA
jgi:OFA family oxalate/formate antiporter-like MFS transporter